MRYNVVLVGSVASGKTSIVKCKLNEPIDKHMSTLCVDCVPLDIDGVSITLWDTCGQERFKSITSSYFMRGHIFLLVHDIADSDVKNDLERWRLEIEKNKPPRHDPIIIVVSNKVDLEPFCRDHIADWVREHGFDQVYTSAKTKEGIEQLFTEIKNAITVHQQAWLSPSLPSLPSFPEQTPSPGCSC